MSSPGNADKGRRYDWDAVRMSFVEGYMDTDGALRWPNLREVSELHDVPYRRTRERAAAEAWNEARAAFQAQLEHARWSERAEVAAREMVEIDKQALIAAKAGLGLSVQRLREIAEQAQKRAEAGQTPGSVEWYDPVDARELATLARAASEWRALAAASLGLPAEVTAVEHTGPGGQPLDIRQELMVDDPEFSRVTGILVTMERAGLLPAAGGEAGDPELGDPEVP